MPRAGSYSLQKASQYYKTSTYLQCNGKLATCVNWLSDCLTLMPDLLEHNQHVIGFCCLAFLFFFSVSPPSIL